MRKGEATRAKIIEEALHQASVRGYSSVSLNDVADAVELSKSAVFKHFQSKEALQFALIEHLTNRFRDSVWLPAEPLAHGRPRLDVIFDRWLGWVDGEHWRGGCPIMVAAIELDDQPGPLRDFLKERLTGWARADPARAVGAARPAARRGRGPAGLFRAEEHPLRLPPVPSPAERRAFARPGPEGLRRAGRALVAPSGRVAGPVPRRPIQLHCYSITLLSAPRAGHKAEP